MIKTEIMVRPFPSTRKDKGFYAYIHYDNWTKQVTIEGKTKQEAIDKAKKYCNKNGIEYEESSFYSPK